MKYHTHTVMVGSVAIGGKAPIAIQSMTDTDTADIEKTIEQIQQLADAGSEIVRVTVNNEAAAQAIPKIKKQLIKNGYNVPIVGDFHYNGHVLLSQYPECAQSLDKYRINPGNVGFGNKKDPQFKTMIDIAIKYDKPVRIGVNWGSLDKQLLQNMMNENAQLPEPKTSHDVLCDALIASVMTSAEEAVKYGLPENKILLSCKVSNVSDLIHLYQRLAQQCQYPLHVGLTEAGMGNKGIISSAVAIGILLHQGVGSTIRVSLTPEPGTSRTQEVMVCKQILQSLSLRQFLPEVTACPGCGRTSSNFYRTLTQEVNNYLTEQMPVWSKAYPGVVNLKVAVMGCIVNGPGESKHANIGISLPGSGESPITPVFIDGKKFTTLRGDNIVSEYKKIIENYVKNNYQEPIKIDSVAG